MGSNDLHRFPVRTGLSGSISSQTWMKLRIAAWSTDARRKSSMPRAFTVVEQSMGPGLASSRVVAHNPCARI